MLNPKQRQAVDESIVGDNWLNKVAELTGLPEEEIEPIINAILAKIPAKTVDYDAILENDPIACDPLIVQGQVSILRLDDIYKIAHRHSFHSFESAKLKIKEVKVNTPPDYMRPNFTDGQFKVHVDGGSHRVEETTAVNYEGIKYLELAMRAIDRGMKTQITVTRRRDRLQRQADRRARGEPEFISNNQTRNKKPKRHSQEQNGDRGLESLRAYPNSDPPTNSNGNGHNHKNGNHHQNGDIHTDHPRFTNKDFTPKPTPNPSEFSASSAPPREPIPETNNKVGLPCSEPRVPCSDCGTSRSEHDEAAITASHQPRGEEPVNLAQTSNSSSDTSHQRQTTSHLPTEPAFHKRE